MIGRVVREAAERFGDRSCYVTEAGWALSYSELDRLADEVAAGLVGRGVDPGDVVALVLPTIPEYVIVYVALARLGAITAGVNARLAPPEREAVLAAADPTLVVATGELAPPGRDILEVAPAAATEDALRGLRSSTVGPPDHAHEPSEPIAIVFTSGTTGTPKGAVFGARQLDFVTEVDTGWRWGDAAAPPTQTLAATSFAHLGPMTKLPGTLVRGGTTHLLQTWRAEDALRLVAEHRMAGFGGIPTQVALMLRRPDFDRHDLSCVKAIVMGGGPANPALVRETRHRFGAAVSVRYSCTEAGIGVSTSFTDAPEDAEVSVGRPHPGVELSLRNLDGDVGEICLRSPAVMSGYWRDEAATQAAFTSDGFVRTGDLGRIDEAGRLRLVGRTKEMYVRGGYNVFPTEVEAVLIEHPGLADVAVVARDDDVMGQVGVAVVVSRNPTSPPTLAELRELGGQQLAGYKLPDDIVVVDRLPLTAMEKVDRRALAALIQ